MEKFMDPIICGYPSVRYDDHHRICPNIGIMYQDVIEEIVPYNRDYFEKYIGYEGKDIANRLNAFRTRFTEKRCRSLLDIGIGSGEFIKKSEIPVYGYDINPFAIEWLQERGLYRDPYRDSLDDIDGITLWDVLEHLGEPGELLKRFNPGQYLFISIPIFEDLNHVTSSKHFRRSEHLLYMDVHGLKRYLHDSGFELLEVSDEEVKAGREGIGSFVFVKS